MGQRNYTPEYCVNVVALAREIGERASARQLKIPDDTLYAWLSLAKNGDLPMFPTVPGPKSSHNLAECVKELERERADTAGEIMNVVSRQAIKPFFVQHYSSSLFRHG